jgi:hypothetical protein
MAYYLFYLFRREQFLVQLHEFMNYETNDTYVYMDREGWCVGKSLELYSRSIDLEYWQKYWLTWVMLYLKISIPLLPHDFTIYDPFSSSSTLCNISRWDSFIKQSLITSEKFH